MASRGELLMQDVLARLQGSPALTLGADTVTVKRSHRIPVTRGDGLVLHVVDGADTPQRPPGDCNTERKKEFTLSLFARSDDGAGAVDDLVVAINERVSPRVVGYGYSDLVQGPIEPSEEIADEDAIRIDMHFTFEYQTEGWTLE